MKMTLVAIALTLMTIMLFGIDYADSTDTGLLKDMTVIVKGEMSVGQIVYRPSASLLYGLGCDYREKVRIFGYRIHSSEMVDLFDTPKYSLNGWGIQVGYISKQNHFKVIPSLSYERCSLKIGEGPELQGWLGTYYESYKHETVSFFPLRLQIETKILPILALDLSVGYIPHPAYPRADISIGITIGNW